VVNIIKGDNDLIGRVVVQALNCNGCRTCELACSFHHGKVFGPSISSIEIIGNSRGEGCGISIYKEKINHHLSCDMCEGEDGFLCVKYCNVLMKNHLKKILGGIRSKNVYGEKYEG
jgi:Fe-S-cluster-containing hydrogenase component 2